MTDIYGANLYNRYLAQQHAMTTSTEVVAQGIGSLVKTEAADKQLVPSAAQCRSILVGFKETSDTNPVCSQDLTYIFGSDIKRGCFSRLPLAG